MQWLAQNWIWIVFAIGILLLMRRGGMGCGMGGHGHGHGHDHAHGDSRHDEQYRIEGRPKDPVSGEEVNPETAVNALYQGRVYYFASRENRDTFEASPARYAQAASGRDSRHHHRHGC